ncbi:SprB repeat-containing protein [Telluribacter humicola]|uniref:SprB repeat-containing protein n=1 Tax=Telluribacter humicola TaxID=1720261 RepID=UPI001A97C6FB|nr:SprB repeat-containing protein [Telluribacter humicola]
MKKFYLFLTRYHYLYFILSGALGLLTQQESRAQILQNGAVRANFGVDAGVYSGIIEYGAGTPAAGTVDWFKGTTGRGVINETTPSTITTLLQTSANPIYERRMNGNMSSYVDASGTKKQLLIDAVWARDLFGGTGGIDQTSYTTASKNGEDPAIWSPGPANVLGKNDLLDIGGHMVRDVDTGKDDLWFFGLINRAEPGGDAYMDFEFFAKSISYTPGSGFSSGGPDLGHTAFQFDAQGNITKVGDFIFNVSLTGGGENANIEVRVWVSRAVYNSITPKTFTWGGSFDGPYTGSPFGYATIEPLPGNTDAVGIVNKDGQNPAAPPWGTKGTKSNAWGTSYISFSVAEVGINLTKFGMDHASLSGLDPCLFPLHTFIVKSRASASFTAQLKDFAGPYKWGQPTIDPIIVGNALLSCNNLTTTLSTDIDRSDVTYTWSTVDGKIDSNPNQRTITVSKPGTYVLDVTLPNSCHVPKKSVTVTYDPTKPFLNTPTATSQVACNGNDGSIKLAITGGTAPYSYAWSNSATTKDISGLSPGTYNVLVTDAVGCTINGSATVGSRTTATITPTTTNATCFGSNNGSITLGVTGKAPFTYSWSNSNITKDIVNLLAGTYTVTVKDADGCSTALPVTVSQPAAVTGTITKTDDTNPDPAIATGSADLTASGGTPGYTYLWSNGATTEDLTALTRNTYSVTITDTRGCTGTASTQIWEPEICNDGIDNNGNGLTDCQDGNCTPAAPTAITANKPKPCVGEDVIYSVTNASVTLAYTWTVPVNATIISGQGTGSLTVRWNSTTPGQICVAADNVGCVSAATCYSATPREAPATPSYIMKN